VSNASLIVKRVTQDPDSIGADTIQTDTQEAVETLQSLQSQLEEVSFLIHPSTVHSTDVRR